MRSSLLSKLAALASVVAACVCAAALSPSAALATWTHVAEEGQMTPSGIPMPRVVAYGAQGRYITKMVDHPVPCTNAFSSWGDPNPGVKKYCDVSGNWRKLADEGQDFRATVAAPPGAHVAVAYGQTMAGVSTDFWTGAIVSLPHEPETVSDGVASAGSWKIKQMDAADVAGSCTNSFFGGDPFPNVKKYCYWADLW